MPSHVDSAIRLKLSTFLRMFSRSKSMCSNELFLPTASLILLIVFLQFLRIDRFEQKIERTELKRLERILFVCRNEYDMRVDFPVQFRDFFQEYQNRYHRSNECREKRPVARSFSIAAMPVLTLSASPIMAISLA